MAGTGSDRTKSLIVLRRLQLEITGTVQGVGFRPHCHALAQRLELSGWVYNHSGGVSIEILQIVLLSV